MSKRIELIQLTPRYFKGIRDFTLNANGEDVRVYGDNAAGKTTLFDAFTWLLFDKDSQNKKDFSIKTLDAGGVPLHNLEHEVEGVLLIDGKRRTLRKVFTEKWTRKRGSATSEFTGHETTYFIDGVPVKKTEYSEFVDGIISEDIFKLLTNPSYFNEQLKWQDRRKKLLDVAGDISDTEVIAGNGALAELPAILGDRNIDDHRKVIAARRAEINKELEKIPVRIDEAVRSKPDTSGLSEEELQQKICALKALISDKEAELSRIQSGGEIAAKEKRKLEIEAEMLQIKNQIQAGSMNKVSAKREEVVALRRQIDELKFEIRSCEDQKVRNESGIMRNKEEADRAREQWYQVDAETFTSRHDSNCAACGQPLPEDQVQAAHDKALANFNRSKSERLEVISAKGKAATGEVRRLEQENAELANRIEQLKSQMEAVSHKLQTAESELDALQSGIQDVDTDPQYIQKKQEKAAIEQEILGLRSSVQGKVEAIRSELSKLRIDVEVIEQTKAKFAQASSIDARIMELQQQEKTLAAEYERLEKELFLTEEFIRTKVNMLEVKINSKFKHARFKLFEQQINGGMQECCETLYGPNLVPYSSGLNRAAQMNVGLDIINTLSEHYGITAPIFIDNAEAVTQLIETKGQKICLIVSAADKQLRVETANAKPEDDSIIVDNEVIA
ncbi:AAA family ATPase [Paenibacillus sp. Pae108]|uniref:AAA family ATPase n=1 Tax=Paenibacillus sp. Pae108 TaxID=2926019 RepID=UPI0021184804|nr:AAA family ATPase [Paenibacillus sp. Pae108]